MTKEVKNCLLTINCGSSSIKFAVELDQTNNNKNEEVISTGKVFVRVMKTDEELMIAKLVFDVANYSIE